MPLFVVPGARAEDLELVGRRIRERLREHTSPRHVPDEIVFVPALPHTRTGKKLEVPVKRLLAGQRTAEVVSRSAVDDVDALQWLVDFSEERAAREADDAVQPTDDYRNWRVYSEQRMSRILSAALETFSDHGYHGTTIRQLAERAGLSVPGVYHHYRSKQDILFDLMMVVIDESIERSRYALKEASASPREQFDVFVESLLRFHMNRQKGAVLSATELRSLTPEHRARYVARRDEQQRMLDVIVSDGVEMGQFHTDHPGDASRAITSLCLGVAAWYATDGELPEDEFLNRYLKIARAIVEVR
jgi:acetoacetyl-CoA synthetase